MAESYMPSIRYGNREPPSISICTTLHPDFTLLPLGHQHRIIFATSPIFQQACLATETRIGWVSQIIGCNGRDFKVLVHWYSRQTGLFVSERYLWVDMWLVKDGWKFIIKAWKQSVKRKISSWIRYFI